MRTRALVSACTCGAHRARKSGARIATSVYWGKPVPGFGDPRARLLLVGLAPAAHGANRTGRVFTGDGIGGSGDFLMSALHRAGFANIPTSRATDDGLALRDAFIAAAVRCAPPDNKPTPEEIARCLPHLDAELERVASRTRGRRARAGSLSMRTCASSSAADFPSTLRGLRSVTRPSIACRTARRSSAVTTQAARIRIRASSQQA